MRGTGPFLFCAALLAVAPAYAKEELLPLDPLRSEAEFQVRVMWLFPVEGRFGHVEGEVSIDRDARLARVRAEIDASKVEMRRDDYVTWVKSAEFFDVARHPRIRFESAPFPLSLLDDGGDIIGDLTLRGETHATHFNIDPSSCEAGTPDCPVYANGTIPRSEFGMKSHRGTLSDKVKLYFTIFVAKG